jgi:cbb3-type cytochrome oxidase subunit 3
MAPADLVVTFHRLEPPRPGGIYMRKRIKWTIIGLGFAFGLQVIISLAYTALAYSAARSSAPVSQEAVSVIVLGLTLGTFLIGGFVVGWTEESFRVVDAIAVALLTLGLSALVYQALPAANKPQFPGGVWLTDQTGHLALTGSTLLFIALGTIAAVAGAFVGWHTAVPSEGFVTNLALAVGLIGAVVGPFVLLALWGRDPANPGQPALPLHFVVTVLALLLAIVGVGFWLFSREAVREATHEEELSISPEIHRHESGKPKDYRKSA